MRQSPQRAKRVWLLGASTGGLEVVVKFLSQVPANNEIAFIYAQHIDEQQIETLQRILANQTNWPVRLAATGQTIAGELSPWYRPGSIPGCAKVVGYSVLILPGRASTGHPLIDWPLVLRCYIGGIAAQ